MFQPVTRDNERFLTNLANSGLVDVNGVHHSQAEVIAWYKSVYQYVRISDTAYDTLGHPWREAVAVFIGNDESYRHFGVDH